MLDSRQFIFSYNNDGQFDHYYYNADGSFIIIVYIMSIIQFKSKQDAGIEYITSVKTELESTNIYKYTSDCDKYFKISNKYKYIGYIEDNIFYVVNLVDKQFDEDFQKEFNFIEKTDIELLTQHIKVPSPKDIQYKMQIMGKLSNINEFKYLRIPLICTEILNLDDAQKEVDSLNDTLGCVNYKLSINYVFQMKENTEINAFTFNGTTLLLCIFNHDMCVSSLVIKYKKSYNVETGNFYYEIYIDSETKREHEGKKLNKLLRAVIIIIAKILYPSATYVCSNAINPTSAYLMIRHFNAAVFDDEKEVKFDDYDAMKTYIDNEDSIVSKVELTDDNIDNANNVFNNIIKNEIKCEKKKGGNRKTRRNRNRKNKRKSRKNHKNSKYILTSRNK